MKDILEANGWKSIKSNKGETYFSAIDKPFLAIRKLDLEVIVGKKVLVNGLLFSDKLVPTVKEAQEFHDEMCDK